MSIAAVGKAVDQAKKLAELFNRRATALESLRSIDDEISTLQAGEVEVTVGKPQVKQEVKRGPGRPRKHEKNGHAPVQQAKRGPGRPRKEKPVEAPAPVAEAPAKEEAQAAPKEGKRFRNKQTMKTLIYSIIENHPKRGIDLDGIVEGCKKAGYQSTSSDEKGYVQNCRTNINSLMNGGKVVKTEDRKYFTKEAWDAMKAEKGEEKKEDVQAA
jgi:hypothetical protein